jgi:hypothetical protein
MNDRRKHGAFRSRLDMRDHVQVKVIRRRLKVSPEQLADIVRKAGHSIAAISKEAGQRRLSLPKQAPVPPAAVIAAAVTEPELAAD